MTDVINVVIPGDKSISHRALVLAVLARGRSTLRGLLDSADTRSTASALRALGANVPAIVNGEVVIEGVGFHGLRESAATLDCGNSGTTARLLMGVAAAQPFATRFDGDASLQSRPMRRVTKPLSDMGARIRELGSPDRLPLEVQGGALRDIAFTNEKSSAQVKSAVLLAAMLSGTRARVCEPIHSRDHTERLLNAMGGELRTVVESGRICVELDAIEVLKPIDLDVPRDFSSAAFFVARGLLHSPAIRVAGVGVNSTRTGLLDVIRRMQGAVHVSDRQAADQEPIATLTAEPCELRGVHVEASEIPHLVDEVPILAVLAARAAGETRIEGAAELRVKETDRLKALATNLRAVGVQAEEQGDALVIEGSDQPLQGSIVTGGDHRIAMAFGILGSLPGNQIEIDDVACVDVSFPGFWQQLKACAQ